MRKDDGLYLLVKSLNKNEKRYINIQLSENLRSGESTLLVLFKFIDVLIKKKEHITHDVFIQKSGIKHIYSTKRLLKEAILRGLRNYHENLNFRWKIETLRKNSELFLSKRLPKQALKEIDKAIEVNPNIALAYARRGSIYYRLGDFQRATMNWNIALKLDPEFTEIQDLLRASNDNRLSSSEMKN